MKIRKLTSISDRLEAIRISSIAFESTERYNEVQKNKEAILAGEKPLEFPGQDDEYPCILWGAFEGDALLAVIRAIDYKQNYYGHQVGMIGIQGVATLPEYRNKGAVRELMRAILTDGIKRGFCLSYLYPFSYPFYAQFGYDLGCEDIRVTVPVGELTHTAPAGEVKQLKAELIEDAKKVYSEFGSPYNGYIACTDYEWNKLADDDPLKTQFFYYLWYNESKQPEATMLYKKVEEDGKRIMDIYELCFTSPAALRGMLAFARKFSHQIDVVRFSVPRDTAIEEIIPEKRKAQFEIFPRGQVRALNPEKLLSLHGYPEGKGQFTIRIDDAFLNENSSSYVVSFALNGVSVKRMQAADVDIRLSSNAFARMINGLCSPHKASYRSDVTINSNHELLDRVFAERPYYLLERF